MTYSLATRAASGFARMRWRTALLIAGAALVLALGGLAWLQHLRKPEVTAAIRGRWLARDLGCLACHGEGGLGGVADPATPGQTVPDWSHGMSAMFIRSEDDIREWILHGRPRHETERDPGYKAPGLIPMPAYEGTVSAGELDDLVAYFLAVSGWDPEIPDAAHEGRKMAERAGCFGCHGPSGMGGVPNPGSFTGTIPPWDGRQYTELVRDETELREWVRTGTLQRLRSNLAARFFLDRQKIHMPPYEGSLADRDLDAIVAYIGWLRERVP